jgi:aldehyde dehydrogenase (NAD+)
LDHSVAPILSLNPTNPSEVIAEAIPASVEQVNAAVEAAADAYSTWSTLPGPARANHLYNWAAAIEARAGALTEAIVREVGKPVGEAAGEVGRCVAILRYFAGDAVRPSGEVIPGLASASLQYSIRVPLGVIGLITPWNFPLAIPLWKAAPALALGNTVVLKPSELSPLCADLLFEAADAARIPAGVFNVVYGAGATGAALTANPLVKAVSFTGSAAVGHHVGLACAARNAKFQTEMGGKNPGIVLKDADLNKAASLVAAGAMRFAGQKCTATSRVIVEDEVHDQFLSKLVEATKALPVGNPSEQSTAVGPVISESAHQRLLSTIGEATFENAYKTEVPTSGYFVPPAIFVDVPADAELAQKEHFGPILTVHRASDLEEALMLANQIPFGLSASLFTQDVAQALEYAKRIEAGLVRVNADTTGVDPHAPFGGVKGSSSGSREQGPAAKDFYSEIKTVQINP